MKELQRGLRKIKRRLKVLRAGRYAQIGLLAGAALALLLTALSFFRPIPNALLWSLSLCAACPAGFALTALLLPVSNKKAALAADQCGLKERVQTALELQEEQETPMLLLQRQDALRALDALQPREQLLGRALKIPLWSAGACLFIIVGLQFVQNPQTAVLRAAQDFRKSMETQAQAAENAAKGLEQTDENAEINRLLKELAQQLRQAQDVRQALTAVSSAEQTLDARAMKTRLAIRQALKDAELSDLANALEQGQDALSKALEAQTDAATALQNAANMATNAQAAAALQSAANALAASSAQAGQGAQNTQNLTAAQLSAAAQSLSQSSASLSLSQLSGLLGNMRASASAAGQGKSGSGTGGMAQGTQGGGGAGKGSTNEDAGKSASSNHTSSGGSAPNHKTDVYESIYDPTRFLGGGEISTATGKVGEGETTQATLGDGVGTLDSAVPYRRVVNEYALSAAKAVENAVLPEYAKDWVNAYFDALLKE